MSAVCGEFNSLTDVYGDQDYRLVTLEYASYSSGYPVGTKTQVGRCASKRMDFTALGP